jgi:hypothetical protein
VEEVYQHFRAITAFIPFFALIMEAVSTSERLINFYWTTWRNIPEDSSLHTHCHENLKNK